MKINVSRDNYISISNLISEITCSCDLLDTTKLDLVAIIAKHEATEHDYTLDQLRGIIDTQSEE